MKPNGDGCRQISVEGSTAFHYLTQRAYRDESQLAARQAIYRFSTSRVDLVDWVLDQLQAVETLVDVGCGNGRYLRRIRERGLAEVAVGIDLSEGMLRDLSWSFSRPMAAVADAQCLPFGDACCDTVLAMHMLYHVPDIRRAIGEFRRVVRTDGTLVAVTNGERHLYELDAAIQGCAGHPRASYKSVSSAFSLENGETFLRTEFTQVERRDLVSRLRVTEVQPVLDYVVTLRDWFEPLLGEMRWDDCMARLADVVEASILETGSFDVTTSSGAFFCSNP